MIGDSHAVHWLPAFQAMVDRLDLHVVAFTKSSCAFSTVPIHHVGLKRSYGECLDWTHRVLDVLRRERFQYIVIGQSPNHSLDDSSEVTRRDRLAAGMSDAWTQAAATGAKVFALAPTPWQPFDPNVCVAASTPPYDDCTTDEKRVVRKDAVVVPARGSDHVLVDLTDQFCRDGRCPSIIGNVFVYRDSHHIDRHLHAHACSILASRLGLPYPRR